jgi:hypothetical protein
MCVVSRCSVFLSFFSSLYYKSVFYFSARLPLLYIFYFILFISYTFYFLYSHMYTILEFFSRFFTAIFAFKYSHLVCMYAMTVTLCLRRRM